MQTVSHFSLKVWPKGQAGPIAWQLQADDVTSQGSIVIATHRADITVGSFRYGYSTTDGDLFMTEAETLFNKTYARWLYASSVISTSASPH